MRARRQADRRAAFADDERRDGHLKPVEQVGFEEHRDGDAAAFDEDPRQPRACSRRMSLRQVDAVLTIVHRHQGRAAEVRSRRASSPNGRTTYKVAAASSLKTR